MVFQAVEKRLFLEKIIVMYLTIFLSWSVFSLGLRGQLLSFFFFTLLLYCISKIKEKPKILFFIPIIFLFWANTHPSVIIGLVVLLYVLCHEFIESTTKNINHNLVGKHFTKHILSISPMTFIFPLSFICTLITPFGVKIYEQAWWHFAVAGLDKLIAEWVPPIPFIWWLILLTALIFTVIILMFSPSENGKGIRKHEVLQSFLSVIVLIAFAILALKARRNVPFYFLLLFYMFFSFPPITNLLKHYLTDKVPKKMIAMSILFFSITFSLIFSLPNAIHANSSVENFSATSSLHYPLNAVAFLKAQHEKGNIFNRYEWGGFLIWQLPEYTIFVDGRMPAWQTPSGKSPYTIYLETLQTQPGWQETLKQYHIRYLLIEPGTFLDLKLRPNPEVNNFKEIYRDAISVVYVYL